ncbi:MAG TPA: 4-hydroxythreonine-4-phosphate dehydrogenase PdxA [Stellaceae bacterium]|nr:4-hydroxythreonine-4-phosphate dehydrogenase PdxA [Stellaceae bacterium]
MIQQTGILPPLVMTMGEPAGIGGEIALKAWLDRATGVPPFCLLDDPARLGTLAAGLGWAVPIRPIADLTEVATCWPDALPVLPIALAVEVVPGRPDPRNAPAVLRSIDRAVALVRDGEAAAVVTNPIHKQALYEIGFRHPGHTEYLAELAGPGHHPTMMLACPGLRVVPVTIHMALRQAVEVLDTEAIVVAGRATAAGLIRDFGIPDPRLAVAGLNPHAGEGGAFGREEIDIVAPAVRRLVAEGIKAVGPVPADTLFHAAARSRYDAVICLYHDQALIPLKTIDFDRGVNITLGLPFVRTSPDHGTAFDIAGTGIASCTSLVAALEAAAQMAHMRRLATGRPVA